MGTPTGSSSVTIIKSDRTGPARYTTQYKREVLAPYESNSLNAYHQLFFLGFS